MAQTGIHYKTKWLSGDNSVNIHGRIMVLVHNTSSHCHLSINHVSFQFLSHLTRYGPDRQPLWKREITMSIYRVGLWLLCTALPLTAIYL